MSTPKSTLEAKQRLIQLKFSRFYAKVLTQKKMSLPQFSLLLLLIDNGPLRMGTIAEKLYLASSSVTNLVDRLEGNQYIVRLADPADRRAFTIKVTAKGKRVVADIRKITVVKIAQRLTAFGKKDIDIILRFYDAIGEVLDQNLGEQT